jgi:superfamily II DNA or RNA helicase
MKLIIDNQLRLLNIPEELKTWFIEQLTFDNPAYLEAVKHNRYLGELHRYICMYESLPDGIALPRGYLQIIENSMIDKGLDISIIDNRILYPPIFVKSNITLRPYQKKAKTDLLSNPNGILVAPAGSGKTIMALDIFASVHQKMLWLTHTDRLAKQVIDRIVGTKESPPMFSDIKREEIGFIGGGKYSIGDRVTVGMVQTLVRREAQLPEIGRKFGLVVCDECHHCPSSTFLKVLKHFSAYYIYACTATPQRRDHLEDIMFASIGLANSVIQRKEVKKEGGIITPTVIKRTIQSPEWGGNDFHYITNKLIIPNKQRLVLITTDILREAYKGNCCIVISTRKIYCEMIYELMNKYWSKSSIATGDYTKKHNNEQVVKLENGEVTVLITTFELLGEGFDVKKLNRGFIVLPFREKVRVEQAVGRIQRTCEGKTDALLYDYVDVNIGILKNQYLHRSLVYENLGMKIKQE